MLRDAKTRRLATEFACHWLHIDDFEHLDEKSERHFPTFAGLRGAMAEESIQFFTDLFQHNGSVLDILDADYTFLNEAAGAALRHPGRHGRRVAARGWREEVFARRHPGPGDDAGEAVGRIADEPDPARQLDQRSVAGRAVAETAQGRAAAARRRGGNRGADRAATRREARQRSKVRRLPSANRSYGFSLEAFDAIGRHREKDLGDRPIDTRVTAMDGTEFDGLDGLRNYLLTKRRDAFVRQFCRKLLGYALGRAVQLSDEPLLAEMQGELAANDYKVDVGRRDDRAEPAVPRNSRDGNGV